MADRDSDHVNTVGEPDEGKPHVRFDEGRLGRFRLNQSPTLPIRTPQVGMMDVRGEGAG